MTEVARSNTILVVPGDGLPLRMPFTTPDAGGRRKPCRSRESGRSTTSRSGFAREISR